MASSVKLLSFLLSSAAIAVPSYLCAAEPQNGSGESDGYRLVWQDLFDSTELNPLRWQIEVNDQGGGNNELQYYTDRTENVRVGKDDKGNGCLILTARREQYKTRQFTSGRVNSKGLFGFKHGKLEAAIKLPKTANGLWPAFWMMGTDFDAVGWPRCGETDILEMGHSNGINAGTSERFFNGAMHWGESWPQASYARDTTKDYSLQDGEFHLFTVIWDDNQMAMYIDLDRQPKQIPYFRMTIPVSANDWDAGKYFHKENFIIFNLAIGGNFPGIHNASGITALNDQNSQEASMYINYVKVYQKGESGETISMMTPGDPMGSEIQPPVAVEAPWLQPLAEDAANAVFDVITLNDNCIQKLKSLGKTVNYIGPDGADRNLWNWSNTFSNSQCAIPGCGWNGPEGNDYVSFNVGTQGWSGAGFNIAGNGVNLSHISSNTRLHMAICSQGNAPDAVGFKLLDCEGLNMPANFSAGSDFNDNGTILPSIASRPATDWTAIDITLGELKAKFPSFNIEANARTDWKGNILSFLCGGRKDDNISLDAIYLYSPKGTGVEQNFISPTIIYTGKTINVSGADSISLFDMNGRLIRQISGSVMGTAGLEPGVYIARSANVSSKIAIK